MVAPEAFDLAEAIADGVRASRSCRVAIEAIGRYGAAMMFGSPQYRQWAERADRHAEPDTADRVRADLELGIVLDAEGDHAKARALRLRALELARKLGDRLALGFASFYFLERASPRDEEERWRLVTEMADNPVSGGSSFLLTGRLYMCGSVYLDRGDRPRAESLWEQMGQLAQRADDATALVRSLQVRPWLDLVDGRLEEAIAGAEHLLRRAEELGAPVRGRQFAGWLSFRPLLLLGRGDEAMGILRDREQLSGPGGVQLLNAVRALWLRAHLGPLDEAEEGLPRFLDEHRQFIDENIATPPLLMMLEIAVQIEDRELCSLLAQHLAPVASLSTAFLAQTCPARRLGAAHSLLGEPDKARAYYHQALDAAGKIGFRPEIALTRLQLAELLVDSYPSDRPEAVEHLDFAVGEFRDMKMQPSLERAFELQEKLGTAGKAVAYPDGLSEREVEVLRLMALGKDEPPDSGGAIHQR